MRSSFAPDTKSASSPRKFGGAAESDAGRRAALEAYAVGADARQDVIDVLEMFLGQSRNRLPLTEIEHAMDQLGLTDPDNGVLSDAEKEALDGDGYVNLGTLLSADQLEKMRNHYDAAIAQESARAAHKIEEIDA